MNQDVSKIAKSFKDSVREANDGALLMVDSVTDVSSKFEPTATKIMSSFDEGILASKEIYEAVKKFLPFFPDLIGTALLNYFGDLRDNVKK